MTARLPDDQRVRSRYAPNPVDRPTTTRRPETLREAMDEYERLFIESALDRNNWCRAKAARELGIHHTWLWELMVKHDLVVLDFPGKKYRTLGQQARFADGQQVRPRPSKNRRIKSVTPLPPQPETT